MSDNELLSKDDPNYVSGFSWFITILISLIPIVDIIYWLCLAFGSKKQAKRSLARTYLAIIMIALLINLAFMFYYIKIGAICDASTPELFLQAYIDTFLHLLELITAYIDKIKGAV